MSSSLREIRKGNTVVFTKSEAGKIKMSAGRGDEILTKLSWWVVCLLTLAGASWAQSTSPSTPPPSPPATQVPALAPPPSDQNPGDQSSSGQSSGDQSPGFVFKKQVEEVVLHATVVDDQNRLAVGLARNNFEVYEDGKLQELTSFRKEQVPVALGILIDNSGSMLPKRAKVNQAALQLVNASQQEDRVFVVNFGEGAFLDQDYTPDIGKLRAALQRVETRGSTALYDAVIAAADHLNQTSALQKRILLVVTDGRDNASEATFQDTLRRLQSKNGPVVYVIALEQNDRRDDDNRQALRALSEQTGGTAFFPSSLDEVQSIASTISRDIRSQYVIGYRSSNPHTPGSYHSIQVRAFDGSTQLRVATRTGYYSGNTGSPESH
jgi:Ca-activated chloride channel homolog